MGIVRMHTLLQNHSIVPSHCALILLEIYHLLLSYNVAGKIQFLKIIVFWLLVFVDINRGCPQLPKPIPSPSHGSTQTVLQKRHSLLQSQGENSLPLSAESGGL